MKSEDDLNTQIEDMIKKANRSLKWLKIENKLGKETLLQEYQKLRKEMEE